MTAKLLTLFCKDCGVGDGSGKDVPLVSVLRDTLGESDPANYKVTAVWLLTYSRPTVGQRTLAAIPFFYSTFDHGSDHVKSRDTAPLLDLSAPEHPAVANVERQVIQWTALDTIATPVRATSRAYRTNEVDDERLHLEEANTYLLQAPVGHGPDELTAAERDFVMARLELRKKLLGGFVNSSKASSLGQQGAFEDERIRARNWELLRQCAEKTGLVFEPVSLAGSENEYGILWYPARAVLEPSGSSLGQIWKLLGIKDPYNDERLTNWTGYTKISNGMTLIPLGLYNLTYPRQPLLLVDFRDKTNLRRRDMTQKSIDEITTGVIGLSHFTNWYYFVASDLFNFVQERRGKANNRAERLDSYGEFRASLPLDHSLDPDLKKAIEERAGLLSSNPLVASSSNEMNTALARYAFLSEETGGDGSHLVKRMEEQRREELANFGITPTRESIDIALHVVTLGKYTHRMERGPDNLELLSVYRRAEYNLDFLDKLVAAGTAPEVVYQPEQIRASVNELSRLMPSIRSPQMRLHAQETLESLGKISSDQDLRADCDNAYQKLMDERNLPPSSVPGILAEPAVLPRAAEELR